MYMIREAGTCGATTREAASIVGAKVKIKGYIQAVRNLGGANFIVLRDPFGELQVFLEGTAVLRTGQAVEVEGSLRKEPRAPGGLELAAEKVRPLSSCGEESSPIALGKKNLNLRLETELEFRPLSLRHPSNVHRFKIQAVLVQSFREYLIGRGFTEIFTPKLVSGNAEGGSNVFKLGYFGQDASLAQSPQLYKQIMVGVFGRVFETGHVYRAEPHCTARHLNEYVSLDIELGFIESFSEVMACEAGFLKAMVQAVGERCQASVEQLGIVLPAFTEIPVLSRLEAYELMGRHFGRAIAPSGSLSAQEEKWLSEVVLKEYGSEFVFVTHYTSEERPFYAKDDPASPGETLSFDLLFRGMEITTGGQRINEHEELIEKMKRRGLALGPFEHYLMAFKHGLPPHGGLGLGLERLTALLTGGENVRQGSLFPRDMVRLKP